MKTYVLRREQLVPLPREEVFRFFESPENLEAITPKSVGFQILTPRPIEMQAGVVLDYTIKLLGLSVRWTTLIATFERPRRFTDVAIRGPYSYWHHTHTFESLPEGTLMKDEVVYALPFGLLGRLIRHIWVKNQLRRIFDFRAQAIDSIILKDVQTKTENQSRHGEER